MNGPRACDPWGATDRLRRGPEQVLDSPGVGMHSALVPPGALHQRVSTALANWQLDAAERLLAEVDPDPSPYAAPPQDQPPAAPTLGRAWADTLRAELLVRRLRKAGYTLVGEPLDGPDAPEPPLDLHAGLENLLEGDAAHERAAEGDARAESASRAALAIALVRSAKAAFDASDDDLQRAAGLVRHARIELLSRRIDAAMDEAVEAASLLDAGLPPSALLVETLDALAAVLADLELMPLALDYQRRAHDTARAAADDPAVLDAQDPQPQQLVATTATRLGELCAEVGEGVLDDGAPDSAVPHFAEARRLAELALELTAELTGDEPARAARVVHGWALVGLGEQDAAIGELRGAVSTLSGDGEGVLLASAELALGRALRRQGDTEAADEHLGRALAVASDQGLPRLRRAALRELCTMHAELDDAGRALPYLQAYLADELDRVDERRTRWVELFGRRKSLLETERAAGQLRRQAYEDPLTHLPNRRYAEARLDGLLSSGGAPALAVVDVDHFKSINDAIGHPGGDAVLRTVADLLVDGVRDTDEVCRWAGDEFVILLPETTAEQAERALERTRRKLAAHDWAALGLDRPVTISVGIASAARGDDRRTLFAAADGVLYDAKRSGRDRVVRLSAVTQTRAGDAPLDALFGPPPSPAPVTDTAPSGDPEPAGAAARVGAVQPSPLDDGDPPDAGFAPLLLEPPARPADPALGSAGTDPLLAPAVARVTARPSTGGRPERGVQVEPDVIWGTGRSTEQVVALVREARREHPDRPAVVLRASADALVAVAAEHDAYTTVNHAAMAAAVGPLPEPVGRVAVVSAGGADTPVAAEAAFVATVAGSEAVRIDDASGSRLRALLTDPEMLADADCVVVVAGPDASLAGLVGALTDAPVVAVPTSTGQPGGLGGLAALITMLNSAAPGVAVSNIDNGFSAGVLAARIARRSAGS